MATKKDAGGSVAPEGNRHRRNSPKQPYDADEGLQRPHEDYDEKRKSSDPKHENDFDVDEDDPGKRKDEYKDFNKETRK